MTVPTPTPLNSWTEETIRRICFHGDSRGPEDLYWSSRILKDQVSLTTEGFIPNYKDAEVARLSRKERPDPVYREGNASKIGDISNDTGVCVSKLFQAAVRFPIEPAKEFCWVYALWVERGYNTKRRQALEGMQMLEGSALVQLARYLGLTSPPTAAQAKETLWSLFGEELVVKEIPVQHIIGGIKVRRPSAMTQCNDFSTAVDYELISPIWVNAACNIDETWKAAGLNFLNSELVQFPRGQSTVREQAFSASTKH